MTGVTHVLTCMSLWPELFISDTEDCCEQMSLCKAAAGPELMEYLELVPTPEEPTTLAQPPYATAQRLLLEL
jgi:hypothetical protein